MLTDKAVKAAKPALGKTYRKLFDQHGLYLFVKCIGDVKATRSWRYDYRLAGRRETFVIGPYPAVSLAQARADHLEARKLVAAGRSPVVAKRERKTQAALGAANTVKALGDAWYTELAPHKSDSWREGTSGWLKRYVYPKLGTRALSEVTPADVLEVVREIASKHPKTAEGVRLTVARIFTFATRNLRAKSNPAREIAGAIVVPPPKHHKPIPAKEIPAFIEKLDGYPGRLSTKLAAKLLLLTMVRKRELIEATWDEVDFENALWIIRPERMKRRTGHTVPLAPQALNAFRELKVLSCGSEYVFPNLGSLRKPMSASTLNGVFDRLGLDVSPHGLRATASTALNESGLFRADVIERQLSHIERNRIRAAYNQSEYLEDRRAMLEWWGNFIDSPSNLVPFRRQGSSVLGDTCAPQIKR
jgi:integrase